LCCAQLPIGAAPTAPAPAPATSSSSSSCRYLPTTGVCRLSSATLANRSTHSEAVFLPFNRCLTFQPFLIDNQTEAMWWDRALKRKSKKERDRERESSVFGLVALAQNLINSLDGCICCQLILWQPWPTVRISFWVLFDYPTTNWVAFMAKSFNKWSALWLFNVQTVHFILWIIN